jgi:mono/diheme cytochrome c family protein
MRSLVRQVVAKPLAVILSAALLSALAGCAQKMAVQPRYNPLQPSAFFPDGRSARPLVSGTVAWGKEHLQSDAHFYTGIKPAGSSTPAWAASLVGAPKEMILGIGGTALYDLPAYYDTLPFPADEFPALLRRGQERFNIFCSMCHGKAGDGDGMIVQRGFTPPPVFSRDLSRGFKHRGIQLKLVDAPVGYFFDVITNGYGAMPDYASQVPPRDRWAIIAYVRALQYSQNVPFDQLDEAGRRRLLDNGGKKE